MSATTMRFGPEWMRKQQTTKASATQNQTGPQANGTNIPTPPGASSYSSLVTPAAPASQGQRDAARPFSYSREEMLRVWKDGGGSLALPIDVERWEGIVKEEAGEPTCLRELSDVEKQLYATSLNSETRRRQQSVDQTLQDRGKGGQNGGGLIRRRRGDSSGSEQAPLHLGRKASWSAAPGSLGSPALQSPRTRFGGGSGFDGVLDRSENPWVGGPRRRATSGQVVNEPVEEVEEDIRSPEAPGKIGPDGIAEEHSVKSEDPNPDNGSNKMLENAMSNLALSPAPSKENKPTPDLAKVLWSYLDPMGNIQGPFPGETMQQWNDQGYFADDLMMKRVEQDAEFKPLLDIKRRAQGPQVFLSLLHDTLPPPGLGSLPSGVGVTQFLQKASLDGSRHSSPQAVHRSAFLDTFINNGSIGVGAASPSSSQGTGLPRGPGTPESAAVGSRLASRFAAEPSRTGRSITSYSPSDSPAMPQAIRHINNDVFIPSRTSSFDAHQNLPWHSSQSENVQAWLGNTENSVHSLNNPTPENVSAAHDMGINLASSDQFRVNQDNTRALYSTQTQSGGSNGLHYLNEMSQPPNNYAHQEQTHFLDGQQRQQTLPTLNTAFGRDLIHNGGLSHSPLSSTANAQQIFARQMTPVSPWGMPSSDFSRPRPFDSDFPRADNTFVMPPAASHQTSGWDQPMHEIRQQPVPDSWPMAHQISDIAQEPRSLTTANVTQHNEVHASVPTSAAIPEQDDSKPLVASPKTSKMDNPPPTTASTAVKVTIPAGKSKRKNSTSMKTTTVEQQVPAPEQASQPKTETAVPQKAPWATEIDAKSKAAQPLNLRDIQDMEKKKQEARKATERERERAALASATIATPNSDELQFTTSWGLPTSQAGSRTGTTASKDNLGQSSSAGGAAPVWTSSAKPAAKTLKEIQEEEERRKQTNKETMASAAKKVAIGPPPKSVAAIASGSAGGAWSVVGSNGKPGVAATTARPTAVTQASTPIVPIRPTTTANSAPRSVSTAQVPKVAPKATVEPLPPSTDFLKWMRDSLSGLDNSVRFEDIAQMLLSFPIDPDAATIEIIAETVYGSSTLLDGRRFAKEFVANRKQDQAQQRGNGTSSKFTSLADVVKAQPKPVQNDLAGYKVVKKKGKRS